jgi:tetrahydromethanopterin S-methyltransferase subunit G
MIGNELKLQEEISMKKNDSNMLKHRIVEIENKINVVKSEYDQKLQSNEKFLKVYEEKKKA